MIRLIYQNFQKFQKKLNYIGVFQNSEPHYVINGVLDLKKHKICDESIHILTVPNAGGNSINSEAYAMQILFKLYNATTIQTEMEIKYLWDNWKKCDFITRIGNQNVGVSVTRAISRFNPDDDDVYVSKLLYKKLSGLIISRSGVCENSNFHKSILFIWSPNRIVSNLIHLTFNKTDYIFKENIDLCIVESNLELLMQDFKHIQNFTATYVNYIYQS